MRPVCSQHNSDAPIKATTTPSVANTSRPSYMPPDDMRFATSEALFPPEALSAMLGADYDELRAPLGN